MEQPSEEKRQNNHDSSEREAQHCKGSSLAPSISSSSSSSSSSAIANTNSSNFSVAFSTQTNSISSLTSIASTLTGSLESAEFVVDPEKQLQQQQSPTVPLIGDSNSNNFIATDDANSMEQPGEQDVATLQQQQQPSDFQELHACESDTDSVPTMMAFQEAPLLVQTAADICILPSLRSERSNSCSQAETQLAAEAALVSASVAAAAVAAAACLSSSNNTSSVDNISLATHTATSVSHENLQSSKQLPIVQSSSVSVLNASNSSLTANDNHNLIINQANQAASSSSVAAATSSASSRFFSSKLNTGSLWSLLSVGSNASANENPNVVQNQTNHPDLVRMDGNNLSSEQSARQPEDPSTKGGFFNRVREFKRNSSLSSSSQLEAQQVKPLLMDKMRFNVKYIGCTILHKNFTMPMLEWIAKDIKRQSIKGAQMVSQRQFNIPARDILFEINPYQINGIACKDGHAIFVHPMHCITKYVQLQYDQTSFIYLIRDTKESPFYCHLFQAKSVLKVHDIFEAIRKATTKRCEGTPTALNPNSAGTDMLSATQKSLLQKSLSTDDSGKRQISSNQNELNNPRQRPSNPEGKSTQLASVNLANVADSQQQQQQAAKLQFEDSYQFEVMFVKKVKLQCRRVPNSFVDDALETLKSFEVLKGGNELSKANQIKLATGAKSRIIRASVDERQEYDQEVVSQQPSTVQPTVSYSGCESTVNDNSGSVQRRGSSVSLHRVDEVSSLKEERESRSCQQSPTKAASLEAKSSQETLSGAQEGPEADQPDQVKKIHHQSVDSLKSINHTIKSAKLGNAPNYSNDFSPYNTITSNDLNERIAAIPVVSEGSVSLDHETRQKLARQVRETIMATAASIKKDVYASGDKLDSSSSSKALDSLSCTMSQLVPPIDDENINIEENDDTAQSNNVFGTIENRRSSAGPTINHHFHPHQQAQNQPSNNFDLFRRASARQVVKNRTMLLLIGKDELCTISIDKHQMLFSKSFNSIVLCLQGLNNKDHFGLICRDSGKINPQTESYAGFIFKCQSDKVAREIMSALKQVIYNSQHNHYHGLNSPYNPLNTSNKIDLAADKKNRELSATASHSQASKQQAPSLAAKRGFLNSIDLDEAASQSLALDSALSTTPPTGSFMNSPAIASGQPQKSFKSLIKSIFCDNCPLYWYHRLCCDIESLPAEASKAIILRRIDSSLSEKEQDELYSKFSEFDINTIEEHNEIFMSLLRYLNERKQLKHNQSSQHQQAMALVKQQQSASNTPVLMASNKQPLLTRGDSLLRQHQRSGSSSGSLSSVLNQSATATNQSITDASLAAIDNLKKAKNSISVSIENMLKRRNSNMNKEEFEQISAANKISLPVRSGSFKCSSRESRANDSQAIDAAAEQSETQLAPGMLKRSQSTTDYSDSTTNNLDRSIPIVELSRRRSSTFGEKEGDDGQQTQSTFQQNLKTSTECLLQLTGFTSNNSPSRQPASPSTSGNRFMYLNSPHGGGSSPSSMLSSAFWKKSIFDKIRQPEPDIAGAAASQVVHKRSREELRSLWRKAIREQITLIKMDKQNQRLMQANDGPNKANKETTNRKEDNVFQSNSAYCCVKLNYRDVPYNREVISTWENLLKQDPTGKVDFVEVAKVVRAGVPKQRRGEVWMFLMNQYQLRHGTSFQPADSEYRGDANQAYRSLLSQLSLQQHEIFVDIGRTFPTHPYYSQYLSIGQLSLFNLLKAYSLLDPEVGYCQGLSFVAGLLLLHVDSEDEAFELMRHLLFNFGLRKQYLPSMNALHLQLYQLTRLLRDYEYELFNHFDSHDISPSLYAAPWFLTLFASSFPLGFVSRLLDLIFLIGIEAIFRVSLNLLTNHKASLLKCTSLESTMEFMRVEFVKIANDQRNLLKIFDRTMSLDLRNKLIEYEIEYTFYCAEDKARTITAVSSNSRSTQLLQQTTVKSQKEAEFARNQVEVGQNLENLNGDRQSGNIELNSDSSSVVADATATVIIQHLLANNHLKSLKSNYSY